MSNSTVGLVLTSLEAGFALVSFDNPLTCALKVFEVVTADQLPIIHVLLQAGIHDVPIFARISGCIKRASVSFRSPEMSQTTSSSSCKLASHCHQCLSVFQVYARWFHKCWLPLEHFEVGPGDERIRRSMRSSPHCRGAAAAPIRVHGLQSLSSFQHATS